jgi:hypothetical protein
MIRWKAIFPVGVRTGIATYAVLVIALAVPSYSLPAQATVEFLPFGQIQDLMSAMMSAGAPDMPGAEIRDAASWNRWIEGRDREIRSRIDRGIEDSISNLIFFGTSYSALPPIPTSGDGEDASGQLTPAARARVHALAVAMTRPGENERVNFAREFLARSKLAPNAIEPYLEANLQRLIRDEREYAREQSAAGQRGDADSVLMTRATIYKDRGLSFDTSLEPDFAIDTMLKQMVRDKFAAPGSIRRIAVIGPGLDFADKRIGLDFYPVQTLQPFAILESVLRLGLGRSGDVRVVACDLNPSVLAHVERLAARGREGRPYVVQLPNDPRNGWTPEMVSYWRNFGDLLGTPARPLSPPEFFKGLDVRAVAIRPQFAEHVSGQNLDMVAQQLDLPPGGGFDLVIATNVFVYYNFFEQAMAMQNISHMMNHGGFFLVNQVLSNQHPDSLKLIDQCNVTFNAAGLFGDDVVAYQQQ